jgi:hypothetical protein
MPPKLTDNEIYDVIHAALEALGRAQGVTVRGNTALEASRTMLRLMQMGLLKSMDDNTDHIEGLIDPSRSPQPPPG